MRGERPLLRTGEFLVRWACQRLPRKVREERYREWVAELPAILHDSQVRPAPVRAVRMLAYAADTFRGTVTTSLRARDMRTLNTAFYSVLLVTSVPVAAGQLWSTVRTPDPLNYVQLVWALAWLAYIVSRLVHSFAHVSAVTYTTAMLIGVGVSLWNAAAAPGDWVNYLWAALFVLFLAWWLVSRRLWHA